MAFTDTQLRNAKPAEKNYSITDGQGLSILIPSKGAKGWRFRYRHLGNPIFRLMRFWKFMENINSKLIIAQIVCVLAPLIFYVFTDFVERKLPEIARGG
ncbi:Arm DNA-binding domain-containing protein [Methylophilus sp. 3sh_L]|uniref:Arm DNA-binding domain-containing protein n=1 Tax=Methylophilus sp. 3sh_L TaxID=3377114 RepID=UPI00398EB0CD